MCLAGNDRRRGALRFRNIAGSSRYQVDKTMGDRLARGGADVYANVEAFHSGTSFTFISHHSRARGAIVVRRFGRTMELGRSGADADVGFRRFGAAADSTPVERSGSYGVIDNDRQILQQLRWGRLNVELSLPIFRLALAVFIPWRGADGFDRRAGWHPRSWCVGSRAAPAFSFLVFCLAPPSSYRVDRGRHLALSTFAGGSMSSSLSRFSGWRSQSLSLGEGLTDLTGARDGTRAHGVLDRGRRRLFHF